MSADKINDGGPAFPFATADGHLCLGMTLRDYFAAMAMQGELACQREGYEWGTSAKLATNSYSIADAMLKARSSNG